VFTRNAQTIIGFQKSRTTNDDDLELLPLWEERCFVNGPETTLFPSTTNVELHVPNGADAFVFWFASKVHRPFKMLDGKEVEYDEGTRQWIYFLTNSSTTCLKVEFDANKQTEFPHFSIIEPN
jgi:hypothetical protein